MDAAGPSAAVGDKNRSSPPSTKRTAAQMAKYTFAKHTFARPATERAAASSSSDVTAGHEAKTGGTGFCVTKAMTFEMVLP
eukprot:130729-Prymnesium_polylepis.4